MKRNIKSIYLLLIVLGLVFLHGCSSVNPPQSLTLEGRIVSWSEVKGATGYVLKINDNEYEVSTNTFTLPNEYIGEIKISVKSVFVNSSSDFSNELAVVAYLQLETPTNIRQIGNKIVWDPVLSATSYVLKINGIEYMTTIPEYTITINNPVNIQILAVGRSDGLIKSSEFSPVFTVKVQLSNPGNVRESDGVVTWNSVNNSNRYLVIINEVDEIESSTTQISLKYQYVGTVNVKVKALSDNQEFMDSEFTKATFTLQTLTLAAPKDIEINQGLLTFSSVVGATAYEIYANDILLDTITSTTFAIPSEILNASGSYLQVKAISQLHNSSNLSNKVICSVTAITTEAELRNITGTGSYLLENDIILTSDWTPLDFNGVFNGNGFKISNINIASSSKNVGFFGKLENGIIKNLTLEGTLNGSNNILESNIGGLAGFAVNSEVINCQVLFTMNAVSLNGVGNAGGVIGLLQNTSVTKTVFSGEIVTENYLTGGFIGRANNPEYQTNIYQCSTTANITVSGGEQSYSGGFIGLMASNFLTISESFADTTIAGTNYVGGFVGYMGSGKIENCYSTGGVSTTATTLVHMGGFIGRLEGYNSKITSSISMNTITNNINGSMIYIGGFVGRTVGGTYASVYQNCLYDNILAPLDRIGNPGSGIGDGINAKSSNDLQHMSSNQTFSSSVWSFIDGMFPTLKWE